MDPTRTPFRRTPNTRRRGSALPGCLIAAGIVLVIAIAAIVFVVMNGRNLAANALAFAAKAGIEAADLPSGEKPELKLIVDDVRDRFKAGDITSEEGVNFFNELTDSPLFMVGMTQVFENAYLPASSLSEEEQTAGAVTLQRFARGLADGTISNSAAESVFANITEQDPNDPNKQTLKGPADMTDEEVKAVLEQAATQAETAGVSATPTPVDISDLLQAEVDAAFGPASPDAPGP